jgi:hypothetical protein
MGDIFRDTGESLMKATGAPQIGKAISAVGEKAIGVGDVVGRGLLKAKQYAQSKIATPTARTADIALPKEPTGKRALSRGRR